LYKCGNNFLDGENELGIDGLECYYPSHTNEVTNICVDICKSNVRKFVFFEGRNDE
jgi:hypothetical protein